MLQKDRLTAVIAYIFVLGWLYAAWAGRKDSLVRFHLKQSVGIVIYGVGVFAAWYVFTAILGFIPFAGLLMAVAAFMLVIAAWISLVPLWLYGMVHAWQGHHSKLPLIGGLADRLPF